MEEHQSFNMKFGNKFTEPTIDKSGLKYDFKKRPTGKNSDQLVQFAPHQVHVMTTNGCKTMDINNKESSQMIQEPQPVIIEQPIIYGMGTDGCCRVINQNETKNSRPDYISQNKISNDKFNKIMQMNMENQPFEVTKEQKYINQPLPIRKGLNQQSQIQSNNQGFVVTDVYEMGTEGDTEEMKQPWERTEWKNDHGRKPKSYLKESGAPITNIIETEPSKEQTQTKVVKGHLNYKIKSGVKKMTQNRMSQSQTLQPLLYTQPKKQEVVVQSQVYGQNKVQEQTKPHQCYTQMKNVSNSAFKKQTQPQVSRITTQNGRKTVHVSHSRLNLNNDVFKKDDVLKNDDNIKNKYQHIQLRESQDGRKVFRVDNELLSTQPRNLGEVQILRRVSESLPSKNFMRSIQY